MSATFDELISLQTRILQALGDSLQPDDTKTVLALAKEIRETITAKLKNDRIPALIEHHHYHHQPPPEEPT